MGTSGSPTIRYRRRKRWLAMHAVLFAIVKGFFVGQWLLARDVPLEELDRRVLASFCPAG